MEQLVTAIIPAYNAENYIERCLNSVINQTYKNIEIIVINDGSKDNTLDIIQRYKNVVVLNKTNGGSSSARNYGIKHANGKYIVFIDSDDCVKEDFISTLLSYTTNRNDEIIVSGFLIDGIPEDKNWGYLDSNNKNDIFSLFLNRELHNRIMNKMYPSDLIKNIPFPEGQDIMEDAYFTAHVLEKCNRVIRIPYFGYNYITQEGSLTNSKLSAKQIAGKFSNILEKDLLISKYIQNEKDIIHLANVTKQHIEKAIEFVEDLQQFEILKKIKFLLFYLKRNSAVVKQVKKLCNHLLTSETNKKIKTKYIAYRLSTGSLKSRLSFVKNHLLKKKRDKQ